MLNISANTSGGSGANTGLESNTQVLPFKFARKGVLLYNTYIASKRTKMKYTLITSNGKVLTFFLKVVAEQFQQAYGGVVFTQDVLVCPEMESLV